MLAKGQCVVKPENDIYNNGIERANEDAMCITKKIVAISDGAGGTGILADKWSATLVKKFPNVPFKNIKEVNRWIASFWERFYNDNIEKIKDDPWKKKKFEEEGSSATFLGLWEIKKNKFVCQSYGDTVFFVFNPKTGNLTIQKNMIAVNSFTNNPPLVNWQDEYLQAEKFGNYKFKLKPGEKIIIATDGLAMYIHGAYLVHSKNISVNITDYKMKRIVDYFMNNPIKDFTLFINALEKALETEQTFVKLMKDYHQHRALPNDDITLVFVE